MKKQTSAPLSNDPADIKKRFAELFNRANKMQPAEADVEALRALLLEHKELKLWDRMAGPDDAALNYLLQQNIAGGAFAETWRFNAMEMTKELGVDSAPPVEKLLIRHMVLCWLQMNFIALKYAAVLGHEGVTITQAAFWDRRVTLAQKRFTRATEALARTRAMLAAARYATARADAAEDEQARRRGPRALTA
jgi:hypothetical protein